MSKPLAKLILEIFMCLFMQALESPEVGEQHISQKSARPEKLVEALLVVKVVVTPLRSMMAVATPLTAINTMALMAWPLVAPLLCRSFLWS